MSNSFSSPYQLDARVWQCPMPLLKTKLQLSTMKTGDLLQVLAKDAGSWQDIPRYLANTAHELLEAQEVDGEYHFLIRKG